MSIIRIIHNQENPYVQLNKKALWDERLSLKAIGLWARCMSRPDNWEFHVSEIIKNTKEGKSAIYTAIDELIEAGYCFRLQKREGEKFSRWGNIEYIFFEFPASQEDIDGLKKCLPHADFQKAVFVTPENRTLLKKDLTKEIKKEPPPPFQPKKGKTPKTKEDWRGFFSKWSKEEFEFAWGEYEKSPSGSVKSIKYWLPKVRDRFLKIVEGRADSERIISERKSLAESWQGKKWRGDNVTALKDCVEFTDGPHYKRVGYDVSGEEWEKQTGWTSEKG